MYAAALPDAQYTIEDTFTSDLYTAAAYTPDQDPFGDAPPASARTE